MRFDLLALALALSIVPAHPAIAKDAPGLAPSSPWILDYDTDSCAMRRMFGQDKEQAYVEFRQFGPQLELQATIASNRMKASRPTALRYRFGKDADWQAGGVATRDMGEGFSGVLFKSTFVSWSKFEDSLPTRPKAHDLGDPLEYPKLMTDWDIVQREAAARVNSITVNGAFIRNITLQLGPFDKPLAALDDCIQDLMTHWGIDVEAHKSLTRRATPLNLQESSKLLVYPPEMIRRKMPGIVNVRLAINESGGISACHIQMPLSDPVFEESSCAVMQQTLKFAPALDKDGKAIPSFWLTGVQFQILG